MVTTALTLALTCLIASCFLSAIRSVFDRLPRHQLRLCLKETGPSFFYRPFHVFCFPKKEIEGLAFTLSCAKHFCRYLYAAISMFFLFELHKALIFSQDVPSFIPWIWISSALLFFFIMFLLISHFLPHFWAQRSPTNAVKVSAPIASLFLFLFAPLTLFLLKSSLVLTRLIGTKPKQMTSGQVAGKIIEILQEAEGKGILTSVDRKLIESVITFKDYIVRETMVPRSDIYGLEATTSVREAAYFLNKKRYSRIPVYADSIDEIKGVLLFKDLLDVFVQAEKEGKNSLLLDAPIESLIKPILYTPETKKASALLQEFRHKQVHLAIVVDEYGGTKGLVTMEDILEQIVGDITDESDDDEIELFTNQPGGGWVVDGRMSIDDIEDRLGLKIPQEGDYDTLGGYIFYRTGTIPSVGLRIHHDDFELEILSCTERSVEKVKITKEHTEHYKEEH